MTLIKNNKERAYICQDSEFPMNIEMCKRWIIITYSHQYDLWAQQLNLKGKKKQTKPPDWFLSSF